MVVLANTLKINSSSVTGWSISDTNGHVSSSFVAAGHIRCTFTDAFASGTCVVNLQLETTGSEFIRLVVSGTNPTATAITHNANMGNIPAKSFSFFMYNSGTLDAATPVASWPQSKHARIHAVTWLKNSSLGKGK